MEQRSLGGLQVNVVGLGTAATFQLFQTPSTEEMDARTRVIDSCLANGANFIDSSPMYGESERMNRPGHRGPPRPVPVRHQGLG